MTLSLSRHLTHIAPHTQLVNNVDNWTGASDGGPPPSALYSPRWMRRHQKASRKDEDIGTLGGIYRSVNVKNETTIHPLIPDQKKKGQSNNTLHGAPHPTATTPRHGSSCCHCSSVILNRLTIYIYTSPELNRECKGIIRSV